jgi:hypothetical protein
MLMQSLDLMQKAKKLGMTFYRYLLERDSVNTQMYPVWETFTVVYRGREARFMANEDYLDSLKQGDLIVTFTPLTEECRFACKQLGIGIISVHGEGVQSLSVDINDNWHNLVMRFLNKCKSPN